jgi:hypothetical protein
METWVILLLVFLAALWFTEDLFVAVIIVLVVDWIMPGDSIDQAIEEFETGTREEQQVEQKPAPEPVLNRVPLDDIKTNGRTYIDNSKRAMEFVDVVRVDGDLQACTDEGVCFIPSFKKHTNGDVYACNGSITCYPVSSD